MDPLARSILRRQRDRVLLGLIVFVVFVLIDQLHGCRQVHTFDASGEDNGQRWRATRNVI